MGLFQKLFKKKEVNNDNPYIDFLKVYNELLSQDQYLARSDYKGLVEDYKESFLELDKIYKYSFDKYCAENNFDKNEVKRFYDLYSDLKNLKEGSKEIKKHNNLFLDKHLKSDKEFLDNVLSNIDKNITLDEEQRKVVLSDEDYTLVIAGAGAGKTTTLAAKVSYLVNVKNVDPKKILVISFTNKAVNELKERINDVLHIDCPIATFHAVGNAIIRKKQDEKFKIATSGFLYNTISDYFNKNILSNPRNVDKVLLFFASYFNCPKDGTNLEEYFKNLVFTDFSTLKSNVNDYQEKVIDKKTHLIKTMNNEVVRSFEEMRIANFLYLNNIDYKYEEVYPYHILEANKPYTPDFTIRQGNKKIYLEHFGLTESLNNDRFTKQELIKYKKAIQDKINLHKEHNTTLIYTFSSYSDNRTIEEHLTEMLKNLGIELKHKDNQEVYKKLVDNETNKYTFKFVKLICTFINNFKANNYQIAKFEEFKSSTTNVRDKLFLDIAEMCYLEYEKALKENACVDFSDMINNSYKIIKDKQIAKERLDFDYIIVDEYQDVSRQRFDLTHELSMLCDAKIIAVGDDWQSIYAFSGSDISLFTHFADFMGYAEVLYINNTYRNAQELIDIAGSFIQKNDSQIKKTLKSPKSIVKPILIYPYKETYSFNKELNKESEYSKKIVEILGLIAKANIVEKKKLSNILLVGRYGFDGIKLAENSSFVYDERTNKVICKEYPNLKIDFLTAHSSKGLTYDDVVIINAKNETYGFPSQIDDDPLLQYVVHSDHSFDYAEERRLFYVALTRTKNRVFIVCPDNKPSPFVSELINDYDNVCLKGELINTGQKFIVKNKCPRCGYPLQLRFNKLYGYKMFMCTNDHEVCGFITNDLKGGSMTIEKCDKCADGYLLVKINAKDNKPFLGCSNYKSDDTGCNRIKKQNDNDILKNNIFENDNSFDKNKYIDLSDFKAEHPVKTEVKENKEKNYSGFNTIKRKKITINKQEFEVLVDENDNVVTDIELLKMLCKTRYVLQQRYKKPFDRIENNMNLVNLATYKPLSRNEYLEMKQMTERKYDFSGKYFIETIKKWNEK